MIPVKLNTLCILSTPFQSFEKDFLFVVNGREYKTSRIVADLISPYISQLHFVDASFDKYTIKTHHQGDFNLVISLCNFEEIEISESEYSFLTEIAEQLGTKYIECDLMNEENKITKDNVFYRLRKHEKESSFYSKQISEEIEFVSAYFYDICESHQEDLYSLHVDTLTSIVNHCKLRLKNEDQLLNFINNLYAKDRKYGVLYESVLFDNVNEEKINEFILEFDINDITCEIWRVLSSRFIQNNQKKKKNEIGRYVEAGINFEIQDLKGIIMYLRILSNNHIEI